jgi:hypothetical protein
LSELQLTFGTDLIEKICNGNIFSVIWRQFK